MTDPIEFPTPTDYPPEILAAPNGPKIGDIINLTKTGYPTGYTFEVRIRDLNVDQDLQAHVRLVKEPGEEPPDFERLAVQRGDKPERMLQVTVPTNSLVQNSCARLDLAVSGSWGRLENPGFETIETGSSDIAKALWWIFEGDVDGPDAAKIPASCPREFEVGMTGAAGRGATP